MSKVVAFVAKKNVKQGQGRNGKPYTLYSLKLQDKEGNQLDGWYGCGFENPACNEGDYVQLEAVPSPRSAGNFDVDVNSIRISKNPPKAPAAASSGGSGGGGKSYGKSPDESARIVYQNSRTAAIETVGILLEHNGLKLRKGDTKAVMTANFDLINEAIDKVTVEYFRDIYAEGFEDKFRILETVADGGEVSTEGDGELPDADEGNGDFDDELPPVESYEEEFDDDFE
jgi:hypothetical protein